MTVVTQQNLILMELLGRYYHCSISTIEGWTTQRCVDAIKAAKANMSGMDEEITKRLEELERFDRDTGGNLRNRCHISYLHLDCLRKVLS